MKNAFIDTPTTARPSWLSPLRRAVLQHLLEPLQRARLGELRMVLPDGETMTFGRADGVEAVVITLHRWRALARAFGGGALGWSESYIDGDWDTPDIAALVQWVVRNEELLGAALDSGRAKRLLSRLRHRRNANSKSGSRRNIAFHYDLGNDFYRLWLDETMTYSAALFEAPQQPLAAAQYAKYQALIDALGVDDGARVLEIGCGWGGFAEQLCAQKAVRLEGITLSKEQLAFAQQRLANRELRGDAHLSLCDYRDTAGQYDHIVSIEMLEAVGETYWPTYFNTVYQRLKPGGSAAIQVITIDNARFADYRVQPDFIQTYIFPGGMLPSPAVVHEQARAAGLELVSERAFGMDYAQTLAHWHQRFDAAWPAIAAQGFDERFRRLWRYYLGYCEGGFRAGSIDVYHFILQKPGG